MEKTDDDSSLPSEIICFEILPRLPRASLMRSRCVSKTWKSILTANRGFIWRTHRNFHPHNDLRILLYARGSGSFQTRTDYLVLVKVSQERDAPSHITNFVELPCPSIQRGYANGLVLGHSGSINDPIYILNPITRESVILPNPTFEYAYLSIGFSPSTNEYKVVATTQETVGLVKIFTLGQASWRNIVVDWHHLSFVYPSSSLDFLSSLCVNGALHWLVPSRKAILALDIGEERFGIIPVPSQCKFSRYNSIMEVDGCLCIVRGNVMKETVLWVLKDYRHQVWVKETIIVPSQHYGYFRSSCLPQRITYIRDLVYDVSTDNYLHLYDRKSKIYRWSEVIFPKTLRDLGLRIDYFAVSFDNCLVPLK